MRNHVLFLFSAIILLGTSCNGAPDDTPKTVEVTGIITMKDKPVSGASVVFMPESGPSAIGITDASGAYALKTGKAIGATPGQHVVTITSGGETPMPGTEEAKSDKTKPEIPVDYGDPKKSGLTANVKASGNNKFDFKLN